MSFRSRRILGFAALASVLVALTPVPFLSHVASAASCPASAVCARSLGIEITPQSGWVRLIPPKVPAHVIAFATRPTHGLDYNLRLQIAPLDTAHGQNAMAAANVGAQRLIASFRTKLTVSRTSVRYGGAPGILLRGLPPSPQPAAYIVLAHAGIVYLIIAPGTSLAPDQRTALASLRFISRRGSFPSVNPAPPVGSSSRRVIKGGAFSGNTLTLTPMNSIHRGGHAYSLWFVAQQGWSTTYSVGCARRRGYLSVGIFNLQGRELDRVLHRTGAARNVRQLESFPATLRFDVTSRCPRWSVTAIGVRG